MKSPQRAKSPTPIPLPKERSEWFVLILSKSLAIIFSIGFSLYHISVCFSKLSTPLPRKGQGVGLLLQFDFHPGKERAALGKQPRINTLAYDVGSGSHFRVSTQVVGECEKIISLYPELQSLQEG